MKFSPNENVLRVALIVFSVVFGILSISLITLGAVYIDELWWPRRYVGLDFMELPTLLIVLGSVSLALAILGCVCAKSYNSKLLIVFGTILLVVLCLELTIAVIAFINFDEHTESQTKTYEKMAKQYESHDPHDQLFFKKIEDHYKCCGVTGKEDNCMGESVTTPSDEEAEDENVSVDYRNIQTVGCAQLVDVHIKTLASEVGYYAGILSFLQVVEIGYVYLLLKSLKYYT